MPNQFSFHLPNGWFFSHFHPVTKYRKHFMNPTFCWEHNDTPSLIDLVLATCHIFTLCNANKKKKFVTYTNKWITDTFTWLVKCIKTNAPHHGIQFTVEIVVDSLFNRLLAKYNISTCPQFASINWYGSSCINW